MSSDFGVDPRHAHRLPDRVDWKIRLYLPASSPDKQTDPGGDGPVGRSPKQEGKRPIRTQDDHRAALVEIDRLWGAEDGTPDGDKLDVLATLVVAYEDKQFPIPTGTPVDILNFAVTDMGRSQKELADLLGSRSQASDLLKGRRRISLDVAQKVSAAWKLPIQLPVTPYERRAA